MSKKNIIIVSIIILITGICFTAALYCIFFAPNVKKNDSQFLRIDKNTDFEQLTDSLKANDILKNNQTFIWAAKIMRYDKQVRCGKYQINGGENNREIIRRLRRGQHKPVKFTFNNVRTKEQFAEKLDGIFFFDSNDFYKLLNDSVFLSKYGFDTDNCLAMFIPNTYEIYYDITAEEFFAKMVKLYGNFWQGKRSEEAEEIGLTKIEVSILASIVEEENHRNAEKAIIAGLSQ